MCVICVVTLNFDEMFNMLHSRSILHAPCQGFHSPTGGQNSW
jgi:hypothetical protein